MLQTVLTFALAAPAIFAAEHVYFGTYTTKGSEGIYRADFNPATGQISEPVLAAKTADPSFLIVRAGAPLLYAVNEGKATVSAFRIDRNTGALTLINQAKTSGDAPCHLALDATGRLLAVANYTGGSVATFPIREDGGLNTGQVVQFHGSGPDRKRQEGPHAHSANFTADNRYLFVDDLGTDRIMIFRVDSDKARIEPANPPFIEANPGSGPRHLVIDPKNRFVYGLNELASAVTRYSWDSAKGNLQKLETISALPEDFHGSNTAAEIVMDHAGHTIYTSNRGDNSIAVFHVNGDGRLTFLQRVPSGGNDPRGFTLDSSGRWLVVANQNSGEILSMPVDPKTGRLGSAGPAITLSQPVSVVFARY